MSEVIEPGLELMERQNRFVSENLRRIFLQIYRMVGSVADAQDLTQEAFIKALERQDQVKDEAKAAHWLSRIATNTAIDFLRRSGRVRFCSGPNSGIIWRTVCAFSPPGSGRRSCCATWKACRRKKWRNG